MLFSASTMQFKRYLDSLVTANVCQLLKVMDLLLEHSHHTVADFSHTLSTLYYATLRFFCHFALYLRRFLPKRAVPS